MLQPFPTAWVYGCLRIVIWPNDHRPVYAHVKGAEGEAVFSLNCTDGPPELCESYGFRLPDVNRIEAALADVVPMLCEEWRKVHGDH